MDEATARKILADVLKTCPPDKEQALVDAYIKTGDDIINDMMRERMRGTEQELEGLNAGLREDKW